MRLVPESRINAVRAIVCVAVIGLAVIACRRQTAEPELAPQLLFDSDQIAAYLDEFPKRDYRIAEVPDIGRFYVDDNPASVKKTLLRGQPWEPHVLRALEEHLSPGDTVLDIGAHIGALTVPIARLISPPGTVYAFEPQRKIYRELVHNLELNELTNAVPLRFALSSERGIIEMNRATAHDGRVGVGSGGDRVEARTVDSFGFEDVSLMKIDVEGHEADVLRGAEKTISEFAPVIIIEIWPANIDGVVPILQEHGYAVRRIRAADYLAIHE